MASYKFTTFKDLFDLWGCIRYPDCEGINSTGKKKAAKCKKTSVKAKTE